MPDLNDFHAFKSTSSGGSSGGGRSGCSTPWLAIAVIVLILILLGKCAA